MIENYEYDLYIYLEASRNALHAEFHVYIMDSIIRINDKKRARTNDHNFYKQNAKMSMVL